MTEPGLTHRLRQRSRRAGLGIGLSMALATAVCIGGFAWIYARVDPYTTDFVGAQNPGGQSRREPTSTPTQTEDDGAAAAEATNEPAAPTLAPRPTATPSPTPDVFTATHRTNPDLRVNFRPAPSTSGDPLAVLDAGTLVQYLGEQRTGDDGLQWFRFRTEDGTTGWLREGTFEDI
jgi:hypothetical protein